MPYFSIIVPCYNSEATLTATLDSLVAQTFQNWEAIIIDNGSTDRSPTLLRDRAARDPRFIVVSNPGQGPSAARNHAAFAVARGRIIAFCDADDIWSSEKLSQLHRFYLNNSAEGAYGQVAFFDACPRDVRRHSTVRRDPLTVSALLRDNPVCTLSNLSLRRDAFVATGGFDEEMIQNADLDFLVRMIDAGARIQGIDALQVWYRRSRTGLTSDLVAECRSRAQVLASAERLGYRACARAEARHLRRLAERALRVGAGPVHAIRLGLAGLARNPAAFVSPPARARRSAPNPAYA
ncbi:glycosyltransferase family 2 protein [Marinibacterium profundimaris]|uniref:glycosyltransferase family 2 protein n=1 Tax=Marinibacterium profundimaris TaxID=1679460 RepID=UPI001303ACDC|nr:glycosyltransferase family 2 protein [Marinibacterium profundimaris]